MNRKIETAENLIGFIFIYGRENFRSVYVRELSLSVCADLYLCVVCPLSVVEMLLRLHGLPCANQWTMNLTLLTDWSVVECSLLREILPFVHFHLPHSDSYIYVFGVGALSTWFHTKCLSTRRMVRSSGRHNTVASGGVYAEYIHRFSFPAFYIQHSQRHTSTWTAFQTKINNETN